MRNGGAEEVDREEEKEVARARLRARVRAFVRTYIRACVILYVGKRAWACRACVRASVRGLACVYE